VTAFLLGVLAASFLGSLHCVGMCGPLLGVLGVRGWGAAAKVHGLYQLGRLATLLLLGAGAGLLGSGLDAAGDLAGVQRAVAVGAGALMIAWGAFALARGAGWHVPVPERIRSGVRRLTAAAARREGWSRGLMLGAVTPLLPCGWLYLFVIAAAGTGHPGFGAATLAAFWAGSLPALLGAGLGLGLLVRRARRLVPAVTGVGLIALGSLLVAQRARIDLQPLAPAAAAPASTAAPSPDQAKDLPCCGPR
jgi:sulfite exporter TauE/SafE